jgi:hypothetical protein
VIQSPIRLTSGSEPEPDIVAPTARLLQHWQAGAARRVALDRGLDTTLAYDRDVKLLFYAEAGIPEFGSWT